MNRSEIKQLAKKRINNHTLTLFAILLLTEFVVMILSMIPAIGGVASLIIAGPIALSLSYIFLRLATKKKTPVMEDLLYGFRDDNFLNALVGYFRIIIFTFLWSLLFIIPGIIKGLAYSQVFFIMADDPKIEPGEAQKRSIAMMHGHKWEYFVFQLSFIPWHLLAALTFGLLYIYVAPYIETAEAVYYDRLKDSYAKSLKSDKKKTAKK